MHATWRRRARFIACERPTTCGESRALMQVAARRDTPSLALHTRDFASRGAASTSRAATSSLARKHLVRLANARAHAGNVFLRARFFAAAFLPPSRTYTRVHISSSLNRTTTGFFLLLFFFLSLFFFFYLHNPSYTQVSQWISGYGADTGVIEIFLFILIFFLTLSISLTLVAMLFDTFGHI